MKTSGKKLFLFLLVIFAVGGLSWKCFALPAACGAASAADATETLAYCLANASGPNRIVEPECKSAEWMTCTVGNNKCGEKDTCTPADAPPYTCCLIGDQNGADNIPRYGDISGLFGGLSVLGTTEESPATYRHSTLTQTFIATFKLAQRAFVSLVSR